jgi:hypothetical protein
MRLQAKGGGLSKKNFCGATATKLPENTSDQTQLRRLK